MKLRSTALASLLLLMIVPSSGHSDCGDDAHMLARAFQFSQAAAAYVAAAERPRCKALAGHLLLNAAVAAEEAGGALASPCPLAARYRSAIDAGLTGRLDEKARVGLERAAVACERVSSAQPPLDELLEPRPSAPLLDDAPGIRLETAAPGLDPSGIALAVGGTTAVVGGSLTAVAFVWQAERLAADEAYTRAGSDDAAARIADESRTYALRNTRIFGGVGIPLLAIGLGITTAGLVGWFADDDAPVHESVAANDASSVYR